MRVRRSIDSPEAAAPAPVAYAAPAAAAPAASAAAPAAYVSLEEPQYNESLDEAKVYVTVPKVRRHDSGAMKWRAPLSGWCVKGPMKGSGVGQVVLGASL